MLDNATPINCALCDGDAASLIQGYVPENKANTYRLLWLCESHEEILVNGNPSKSLENWQYSVVSRDFADAISNINYLIRVKRCVPHS